MIRCRQGSERCSRRNFPCQKGVYGSSPSEGSAKTPEIGPFLTVGISDDSDLFLLVSLSEPYEQTENCYKLVAGTLEVPAP